MNSCSKFVKPGAWTIFATVCCVATLALPALADPVQIVPGDYERSFTITFPGYTSSATLTDFPVLIRLSKDLNDFRYNKCAANGSDLRFADSDGNLLSHEIDTWNPSGMSFVWVKVPTLNANTKITAYYGNANPPTVNPKDVWSNGYVGVWHLGESARPLRNSTATTDIDFTHSHDSSTDPGYFDECIAFATNGAVGTAVGFGTNFGSNSAKDNRGGLLTYDPDGKLSGFDALSIEIWERVDAFDETYDRYMLSKRSQEGEKLSPYYFDIPTTLRPTAVLRLEGGEAADVNCFVAAWADYMTQANAGAWNFHCAQYDRNATVHTNYLNGACVGYRNDASATTGFPLLADTAPLCLGNHTVPYYMNGVKPTVFNGELDELRISNVARPSAWVKATYDTVHDEGFAAFEMPNDWERYSHRFTVLFPGAPDDALSNFPVLVKISEYDEVTETGIRGFSYADCLRPNGGDLRFADESGNMLASEVDTWNESGESLVWVKVPNLSKSTVITAYYGWMFAPAADSKAVWSNGFLGVWHLGESARPLRDSTANAIHFSKSNRYQTGSEYDDCAAFGQEDSAVGHAVKFFTNVVGKVNKGGLVTPDNVGKLCGLDAMTIEIWAKVDEFDTTQTRYMLGMRMGNYTTVDGVSVKYRGYEFEYNSKRPIATFYLDNGQGNDSSYCQLKPSQMSTDLAGQWNYHCATYDRFATSHTNYLNAASVATSNNSTGYPIHGYITDPLCLANDCQTSSTKVFNGSLDELRISSVARSKNWVKATYDTIKNNAAFTTYGAARGQMKGFIVILR